MPNILFRDYMRSHNNDRNNLKELKKSLMRAGVSREQYQSAKSEFVDDIWPLIVAQQNRAPDALSGASDF